MPRKPATNKNIRIYMRKYKHLLSRPKSHFKFVTLSDEGVTCQVKTKQGWLPMRFVSASGLAADIYLLQQALNEWDNRATGVKPGS